jgi:hypothetical protein
LTLRNPKKTYQLLSEIFDEVCPLFPGDYFHIGGDENEGKIGMNQNIQEFKRIINWPQIIIFKLILRCATNVHVSTYKRNYDKKTCLKAYSWKGPK